MLLRCCTLDPVLTSSMLDHAHRIRTLILSRMTHTNFSMRASWSMYQSMVLEVPAAGEVVVLVVGKAVVMVRGLAADSHNLCQRDTDSNLHQLKGKWSHLDNIGCLRTNLLHYNARCHAPGSLPMVVEMVELVEVVEVLVMVFRP